MPSQQSETDGFSYNSEIPPQYLNSFGFIDYSHDGSLPWTNEDIQVSEEYVAITEFLGIDCEMVVVGKFGLSALGRVSIVNEYGFCIYNTYVNPTEKITDYNTEYSGIRAENLNGAPQAITVEQKVAAIVKGKVLVGHSIHHDLEVLKLDHPIADIRDTAIFFQIRNGNKWTPSLKKLIKEYLKTDIQTGEHSSIQDAQAALKLYLEFREEWEKDSYDKRMKANLAEADTITDITCMHVQPRPPDLFADSESVYIRPNKLIGAYYSSDEYKDIQFRLLMEDLLRPLRYDLRMIKQRRCLDNHFRDIRIVNSSEKLSFEVRAFKELIVPIQQNGLDEVDWDDRDIFLGGSLLILSPDNFNSVKCAKVIDIAKDRRDDTFCVRIFVNFLLDGPNWTVNKRDRFQMIESKAFFLPYEFTLNFLQTVDLDLFPMKKYIVDAVTKPEIATNLVKDTIDFSVLANVNNNNVKLCVNPLDFENWPTASELNLDPSQYEALQKAITQELTIIQGPPGTGKTHISLQIVKLLLANEWLNSSPMLIVSYTNHALDQLLEPVLEFLTNEIHDGNRTKAEQSLLRFGGGCESEAILPCTVRYKEQKLKEKKKIISQVNALEKAFLKIKNLDFSTKLIDRGILNFQLVPQIMLAKLEINDKSKDIYKVWTKSRKEIENNVLSWFGLDKESIEIREKSLTSLDDVLFLLLSNNLAEILIQKFSHIPIAKDELKTRSLHNVDSEQQYMTRWGYYLFLVGQLAEIVEATQHELVSANDASKELKYYVNTNLTIKQAKIIGMTTTGAVKFKSIVEKKLKPKIMLVEEAAHVLEAYVVASLTEHCTQLILIGDHKQLRPMIADNDLSKEFLDVSLMERLVKNGIAQQTQNWTQLKVQHRMQTEIAKLICPVIYDELDNHPDVEKYPPVKGCLKNLFFIHHENSENKEARTSSRFNTYEAQYIICLLSYFIECGYLQSQITVICTYMAQKTLIDDTLKKYPNINQVLISTVDGYQGKQNDIILLSLVRNNKQNNVGFLNTDNRVCVALSRARHGLFMIGNISNLASSSDTWSKIQKILNDINCIGTELPLSHPHFKPPNTVILTTTQVRPATSRRQRRRKKKNKKKPQREPLTRSAPDNSKQILEDGVKIHQNKSTKLPRGPESDSSNIGVSRTLACGHLVIVPHHSNLSKLKCNALKIVKLTCGHEKRVLCHETGKLECSSVVKKKMKCGHIITTACHKMTTAKCETAVTKTFDCGHKAHVFCGLQNSKFKCLVAVKQQNPCGHVRRALCHETSQRVKCSSFVKKQLKCGHTFETACHKKISTVVCAAKVAKTLECGHNVDVFCGENSSIVRCPFPAKYIYPCGHVHLFPCSGTKMSNKCNTMVRRELPCGHTRDTACHQNPQSIKCLNRVCQLVLRNLTELINSMVL